ncbi:Conserved hypothetical protein [gamma proteobacterium HdN1]|nr:Conserved hypothetical protein [gamma proteobacterium HdN1]
MASTDMDRFSQQTAKGYKDLRFDGGLEQEFREYFYRRGLLRQRAAIALGVLLLLVLAPLDLPKLSPELKNIYLWSRIYTACPVLVLAFGLTYYLHRFKGLFQLAAVLIVLYVGMAQSIVVLLANRTQVIMPYEGINLIIMTSFLLAGMLHRYALFCNGTLIVGHLVIAKWLGTPVSPHQEFFMVGHFVVGATGGYIIEFNSRRSFLQRGMMSALAQTDALTGIYNRGAINHKLERIFNYAHREQIAVSLLLADIDYFKRYNDLYGHLEGDRCIQAVASAFAASCRRPLDFAGRYGGEEFVLVWLNTSATEAASLRDGVEQRIRSLHITHKGSDVSSEVTISGGLVTGYPGKSHTPADFLKAADDGLYKAKAAGRNQIVLITL